MTPRDALYNIVVKLGPPKTLRDDNLSPDEVRLRDSVKVLQDFINEQEKKDD